MMNETSQEVRSMKYFRERRKQAPEQGKRPTNEANGSEKKTDRRAPYCAKEVIKPLGPPDQGPASRSTFWRQVKHVGNCARKTPRWTVMSDATERRMPANGEGSAGDATTEGAVRVDDEAMIGKGSKIKLLS